MQRIIRNLCVILVASATSIPTAGAVSLNQTDDFQDGTTMGWVGNRYGAVTNLPDGGPQGVGDRYLETSLLSAPFPFHLGVKNDTQWTGDYLAAGIGALEMDLNRSPSSVHQVQARILIFGPGGTFASKHLTTPVTTGTWTRYVFDLPPNALVHVTGSFKVPDGTGVLTDTLQNVTNVVIRHDRPAPTPPGQHPPHIVAALGIDNIRAVLPRPVVTGIAVTGGVATVGLSALVPGGSNVVETADALAPPAWSNATGFAASGTTTNLIVAIPGNIAYFRVRVP